MIITDETLKKISLNLDHVFGRFEIIRMMATELLSARATITTLTEKLREAEEDAEHTE